MAPPAHSGQNPAGSDDLVIGSCIHVHAVGQPCNRKCITPERTALRARLIERLTDAQHQPHSAIPVPDGLYEHEVEAVVDALLPEVESAIRSARSRG